MRAQLAAGKNSLLIGVTAEGTAEDGSPIDGNAVCQENAQNSLRTALDLDPEHAQAEHMLAAMLAAGNGEPGEGGGGVSKASPAFVKALFDEFSGSFDEKLAALGYAVPKLLGEAIKAHVAQARGGRPFRTALDAGCGTGLAGPYLRPLVQRTLAGVDLSPKMLEKAAMLTVEGAQPVYDQLSATDLVTLQLEEVLPAAEVAGKFELVAAADVLVYFGELLELLASLARLSSDASVLIFSCERATDEEAPDGWRLRPSGRFAHTRAYVEGMAARAGGFQLVSYEEIVPRMEYGKPIHGHLFVFMRGRK